MDKKRLAFRVSDDGRIVLLGRKETGELLGKIDLSSGEGWLLQQLSRVNMLELVPEVQKEIFNLRSKLSEICRGKNIIVMVTAHPNGKFVYIRFKQVDGEELPLADLELVG